MGFSQRFGILNMFREDFDFWGLGVWLFWQGNALARR